ncbi:unnamed protein product, partial [marine sediment metagenome]
ENVTIDKSLTLSGAQAGVDPRPSVGGRTGDEAVIDGGGSSCITVTADDVVIDGFTLTNAGDSEFEDSMFRPPLFRPGHGCVSILPSHERISVRNNALLQSGYGVWIDDHSQYVLVETNVMSDCDYGVYVRYCEYGEVAPTITKNDFYDDIYGIYARYIQLGSSQVFITENYFEGRGDVHYPFKAAYGIYAREASIHVKDNKFVKCGMCGMDSYTHGGAIAGVSSMSASGWKDIKRSVIEDNVIIAGDGSAIEGYFCNFLVRNNEITQLAGGYDCALWIRGGT